LSKARTGKHESYPGKGLRWRSATKPGAGLPGTVSAPVKAKCKWLDRAGLDKIKQICAAKILIQPKLFIIGF
jgi:hypothetical protein